MNGYRRAVCLVYIVRLVTTIYMIQDCVDHTLALECCYSTDERVTSVLGEYTKPSCPRKLR